MKILVTGSAGMIGSHLVKELLSQGYAVYGIDKKDVNYEGKYEHSLIDLGDLESLEEIFINNKIDRVIHLAALAHATGGKAYPKEMYEYLNVECSNNIFKLANKHNVPVLFISTVDVFGFQNSIVSPKTECKPVTIYGKTKYKAECLLRESGCRFTVFRFSPVYTKEIKRDIQKRIYLKYPNWAYQIGKNSYYEVLNIERAVKVMTEWCGREPQNDLAIIKDEYLLETKKYIEEERKNGKAKHVIKIPRWIVYFGYGLLRITGKNKFTFLINKAVHPLRSE